MKVICKRNNTKLIGGNQYEAICVNNTGKVGNRVVLANNLGRYSPKNFTLLDGSPLPEIEWESPEYKTEMEESSNSYMSHEKISQLKIGDIIVCKSESSKFIQRGRKYKITDLKSADNKLYNIKVKIEGHNRWLSPYVFRISTKQETRSISLGNIFGDTENVSVNSSIRKIDSYDDVKKNKELIKIIFKSLSDPFRHDMSVIDWAISKSGKNYDLVKDDFKPFLNMKLSAILNKI
jgi:hypothetical protein